MRPVRRSLKNQRTAQAFPIPDVHRGIGIGMCPPATAFAAVGVFVPVVDTPIGVTTLPCAASSSDYWFPEAGNGIALTLVRAMVLQMVWLIYALPISIWANDRLVSLR